MTRRTWILGLLAFIIIIILVALGSILLLTEGDDASPDETSDLAATVSIDAQPTQLARTSAPPMSPESTVGEEDRGTATDTPSSTETPSQTLGAATLTALETVTPEIETGGTEGELPTPVISSIPTHVAVVVRDDETGQIIGDGNLRVFAPENVTYPETSLVELELRFRSQYITPTPFGFEITRVPVVTATPIPGRPTPTEAIPIYEELNVQFFDLMGATLFCLDLSFEGCDAEPNGEIDPEKARPINLDGTNWRWILAPNSAAQGIQNLDIRLWTVDDQQRVNEVWNHAFSIEVNPGPAAAAEEDPIDKWLPVIAIAMSVIAIGSIMGIMGWRRFRLQRQPRIFISYRRQDSQGSAGRLYDRLRERFGDGTIFRDVDTIGAGADFVKDIHDAIEKSDIVIVVIGNKWLTVGDEKGNLRIHDPDDFVRLELATALAKEKRVIPALVDDALMPDAEILPEDLRLLAFRNAVHIRNDSFDDDVNRLLRHLYEDR